MRDSTNPAKSTGQLAAFGHHRVVIPVHIPHQQGYFAASRSILGRCLESLRLTAAGQVAVTLVSDGSCAEVVGDLRACQEAGWVDQVVIHEPNRGKVDSIIAVARGSYEDLVTVADADVLFRPGWVQAVEALLATFPECGFASLFPSPPGAFSLTSATLIGALVRRELALADVVDETELNRFIEGIGSPDLYPPEYRKVQVVVERSGVTACVGAPHWVFTLRRAVIKGIPPEPARRAIGDSEVRWLDEPADRRGYWRLSTSRAFAQHMGNVPEPWMDEELAALTETDPGPTSPPPDLGTGRVPWLGRVPFRVRQAFVSRIYRPRLERRMRRAAGVG